MAGGVRNLQRQNHDEGGIVRARQQITEIPTDMVRLVDKAQTESPGDVWTQEDQDEEASIVVREAIIQKAVGSISAQLIWVKRKASPRAWLGRRKDLHAC